MIHLLLLLDRKKSIGIPLFDNGRVKIHADLLISLVQALMLLGDELGESKGPLREAELGIYQISILSKDDLAYVALQDTYDSEPFTRRIMEDVISAHHEFFDSLNLNYSSYVPPEIADSIANLLNTMKFPKELLPEIAYLINDFMIATHEVTDTFLLADLDDGIVKSYRDTGTDGIIKLLMELLSEIPFERQWIGESKLREPVMIGGSYKTYETWFLHRIGLTDFCFLGRAYYNRGFERDILTGKLEELAEVVLNFILRHESSVKS